MVHHPTGRTVGCCLSVNNGGSQCRIRCCRVHNFWQAFIGIKPQLRRDLLGRLLYYSAGQSAQSVYNDIDKTMLARLGDLSATGIYGAAYRLIDVSLVPVKSLLSAAYPGCFRAGQVEESPALSNTCGACCRSLWPLQSSLLCPCSFVLLFFPAHSWQRIHEYGVGIALARITSSTENFSLLFCRRTLTGAGYQGLRTMIQFVVAAVNVLVNLWIIPAYFLARCCSWSEFRLRWIAAACLYMVALSKLWRNVKNEEPNSSQRKSAISTNLLRGKWTDA